MDRELSQAELDGLLQRVIGAAIEVHRHFGAGMAERTYQQAMMVELTLRAIPFREEVPIQLMYKDQPIGEGRIDLLVAGQLVVELKAAEASARKYRKQVVAYLKATGLKLGVVINFEVELLKDGIARVSNSANGA